MSTDKHEQLYTTLLDIQKQMGLLSRETGEQTKKLDALNDKVAIANGRTAKNEGQIAMLKEWRKYILGGMAVLSLIGTFTLQAYIKKISEEVVRDTLAEYETN